MKEIGDQCFIPFRFQGQYEDGETGLYYNRWRYYDPSIGQYTQKDPIGLVGNNPTLYGYVYNTLEQVDPYGLVWCDLLARGLGHHVIPRSVAAKLNMTQLSKLTSLSWYPNPESVSGSGALHQKLHAMLKEAGIPFRGSTYTGTEDEFWKAITDAYKGEKTKGFLKTPFTEKALYENLTPDEAVAKIKELYEKGELPTVCGE